MVKGKSTKVAIVPEVKKLRILSNSLSWLAKTPIEPPRFDMVKPRVCSKSFPDMITSLFLPAISKK